jgi:hypothetical protein
VDNQTLKKKQNKGSDPRSVLSLNGRVCLRRRRYYSAAEGSTTPSNELIDVLQNTISLATRQLCSELNRASRSFEMTADHLKRAAQLSLCRETMREVIEADGKAVLALAHSGELEPTWHASQCKRADGKSLVYLSSDGFTVPTITDAEKRSRRRKVVEKRSRRPGVQPRLRQAKRGTDQRYKEFKAVMFYDHELQHRQVSVTRGDCRSAGRLMSRDAWRLGFAAADQRVGNIDGGPWIINQIRQRKLQMTAIGLDFFHLGENVGKTKRTVFGEESDRGKKWAEEMMHAVKHQGYDALRTKLMDLRHQTRGAKRKEVDRLIEYASDRREMIRYPEFIANGWQIGSGPMESECGVLPGRLKGQGKRWDMDNAESVMALEAMHQSGQAANYWRLALSSPN